MLHDCAVKQILNSRTKHGIMWYNTGINMIESQVIEKSEINRCWEHPRDLIAFTKIIIQKFTKE